VLIWCNTKYKQYRAPDEQAKNKRIQPQMSAALHLAKPDDLAVLQKLVASFHNQENIEQTDRERGAALLPLLDGTPHGAAYLIGPRKGAVGYIIISFGSNAIFCVPNKGNQTLHRRLFPAAVSRT